MCLISYHLSSVKETFIALRTSCWHKMFTVVQLLMLIEITFQDKGAILLSEVAILAVKFLACHFHWIKFYSNRELSSFKETFRDKTQTWWTFRGLDSNWFLNRTWSWKVLLYFTFIEVNSVLEFRSQLLHVAILHYFWYFGIFRRTLLMLRFCKWGFRCLLCQWRFLFRRWFHVLSWLVATSFTSRRIEILTKIVCYQKQKKSDEAFLNKTKNMTWLTLGVNMFHSREPRRTTPFSYHDILSFCSNFRLEIDIGGKFRACIFHCASTIYEPRKLQVCTVTRNLPRANVDQKISWNLEQIGWTKQGNYRMIMEPSAWLVLTVDFLQILIQ